MSIVKQSLITMARRGRFRRCLVRDPQVELANCLSSESSSVVGYMVRESGKL